MSERKMNIDLGLTLDVSVPSNMSDQDVLDAIYRVACGEGDPRNGMNLMASLNFYVQSQIEDNLKNIGSPIQINGCGLQVHPQGDSRTPRQRALDYAKAPEFTGESNA